MSELTKQDYLTRRALDKQVIIVPSSRVVKSLKSYAGRIAGKLDALTISAQLDDVLLNEIRWLSSLTAAFARYGEEDFDAIERILSFEKDKLSRQIRPHNSSSSMRFVNKRLHGTIRV